MPRPLLVGLGACAALLLLGVVLTLTARPRDVGVRPPCPQVVAADGGPLSREFTVNAGFYQLFFADAHAPLLRDSEAFWNHQAILRHMAAAPGLLGVRTVYEGEAKLPVEVLAAPPPPPEAGWDHVVEGPLALRSGLLAVLGCPEPEPVDACLQVAPGDYRVRVSSKGWAGEHDPDSYLVQVWPAPPAPIEVLRADPDDAAVLRPDAGP